MAVAKGNASQSYVRGLRMKGPTTGIYGRLI